MSEVPQSSYYFKYLEAQTVITEDIKITDPNFDNITVNNDAVFRQGIRVDTNLGDTESNVSTFTVSANLNKVGIGTETPNSTLHILNNTDTYQLKIANNNSDFLGINVDENNNTTFINNTSSGVFNFSNHINANSGMDITNNLKVQYDSNKILTINTDQNNNSNFSINNNGFFNFNNLLKANDGLIVSNNNLEIINQGITQTGTNEVNLSGNLKITNNTPVNDNLSSGALIVNGGAGVSLELKVGEDIYVNDSIYVGNDGSGDIYLKQDGGSIKFGDDSDVTIQHVHNSGLIISGNLTVNGTTTTINTDNSTMKDTLMELGNGRQDTPIANDSGIVILRNTSNNEDNAFIGFDESEDKFIMGTGTFTGSSTGNLTINRGDLLINDIICNNVSGSLTGNSATSTRLLNSRTIQATGDISWSVGFDGSSDVSGSATLNYIDFSTLSGISGILGVSNGGTGNSTGNAVTATALQTSRTIGGVSFDGSANINLPGVNIAGNQNTSGNAATATVLQTARNIGGVSFNGSTDIDLPGVNTIGDQDTNGNAATATTLETARNIGGVSFNGSTDIDLPGVNTIGDQDTSGNAATATTLATARNIGGVSFNGSTDIDLPGVNTIGDQDTSGNAATATTLETARTIGGVSFNGSTDIDLPGVNTIGDQDTSGNAATATTLETARNIGGVSFNGSTDIDLPGVNTTGNQDTTGSAASLTANYISGLTEGSLIDIVHTPNSDSNATIAVDLSEATDTTIVDGDYIVMLDGGIGGTNAKTSISNISNLFAGTGLTSTNSVLNIDSSQTQITSLGSLNGLTISSSNTVNMGNNRIQNVTDPISAQDAATKAYVDSSIQGLHILNACKAATTSNISLDNTTTTIDGVTLSNNDRVLVKDQTAGEDNGIYIVSTSGSWARSEDFNDSSEIDTGDFVFIGEGTINGSHGYVLTTTGSITLGTTLLEWTQFSGAGQIEAGNGLQKNNQLISVDLKTNGGLVIESQKLAVDLSGSSITGTLSIADGGTGATSAEGARTTLGVDPAGTDNSTDVTLTTVTSNYLSINGQEITAGIVPISLGGTGATSAADARTALGVDAAGTDNSTNVTLTNTDYLSISGQAITAGTVPISKGGTGATSAADARTNLGVDAAGTDNSTNVTLTNTDYLSISGQAITAGTVPISKGGTGATSPADARTALGVPSTFSDLSGEIKINDSTKIFYSEIIVTVSNSKYILDGTQQQTLNLQKGITYRFNLEDSSVATHPFKLSTTSDGTHSPSGSEYTTGVTTNGTAGSSNSYVQIIIEQDTPLLYYYCGNHSGMGGMAYTGGTVPISLGGTGATSAADARTALGVDAAGTDNSTNVTLTNTDYLSINGQAITAGTVPISKGGTGATSPADARTALGVDPAGTDNSTNVTLTNTDYLSINGQAITAGTVPISRGGTGLTSLGTAGQVLTINSGATALEWADSSSGTVTETFKTIEVSGQNSVVADSATDTLTLAAGTGMTITTDNSTDTITFSSSGGGTASNSFETISVSGQNSVVADSATDTLTLVAGTGMTITTDNSTDTITFSSSGGGTVTEAFKTISISGQSDVVADSATDTLTLVAGSGINLTTDANGDSITITNTGGGGGGGSSTFIGLSDTPSNFSGQSNKLLKVNSNENALEYVDKVTANPGSTTGQLSSIAIDGINYSISGSGGSGNSATEGALILDSYTVTANTNTQDITLDVGSSYADYEYFSLACVNLEGTLSGYIVWQPIDTSDNLHNTTTNSKWDITNITDTLVEALTQKNENYHILSYHTLGKQYINAKIFGLNLSDKKYSIFNSIGLHSTGTNTISQDGSTSQSSTTICQKIRINNYSTTNTKGSIRNGTFILYGHKKTGVISSNLLPLPTVSNATRTLQVKEDGSGYEFTDFVKGINNTGMHLLSRQHKTSAQSSSGWIFNITNYEDYDYFKLVGVNVRCSVNGALVWRGIKASDNTENMTNSEYSYIFSNIGSTGTGSNAGSNPGVNLTGSHLIADSTPGPVNFEVTIYGLNKSEQKYSTFHSSGQTSSTEYDNNTSYYYTGSTLQYGSSSSENYKCNGIKIYNNNSSNNFYGTIMLYGFRNNSNVVSTINYNGSELLDNKIIDTNSQNLILDCGSAYESYEYFELVCTNIQGTVNGYIGWQPYTSNPITTSTSTKWKTFTITDNTPDVTTNESKQWHILGFTTQGKQQIRSQIYNLNKVDKKYCKFNNIGLHSNTTDTISQEGSTSQIDNTKCRYIVINNFAEADTTNATGYISAGTIMLYGYKTNKSAAMTVPIPNPTFEDAGKVLQLDSTGTTIEYADKSIHNSIVDGDMIIGNDNDNIMVVNSKSEFNQEIKGNLRGDVVGKFEGEINNGNLKGTTIIGEDKDDLVIVNGDTKLLGNVNIGNNTNTEIKGNINIINNIKLNSTPLITQIHGFYQSKVNTNAGNQWLNHVAPSEAHITANSIKGMKSVVNMMPYALTFTSDADTEEETNFTFEIRARNDTSSDAALDTSNTTNRGTITLNNLTTSKGEMGLINNPSQISTNQNWGLYINSAVLSEDNTTTNDHFGCEFLVKVYFYQV